MKCASQKLDGDSVGTANRYETTAQFLEDMAAHAGSGKERRCCLAAARDFRLKPSQADVGPNRRSEDSMASFLCRLWGEKEGQDIAEYAVMLAVILVIVVGTLRLIGSNANNAFSSVASTLQ